MWKPSDNAAQTLRELGATYFITQSAATYAEDEKTGKLKIVRDGTITCHIYDITTQQVYASAAGAGESEALENALAVAVTAPKPMTPAQARDVAVKAKQVSDEQLAALTAQNATLQKQADAGNAAIATLTAQLAALTERLNAMSTPAAPATAQPPADPPRRK